MKIQNGIRNKISLGMIIIGFMLAASGALAYFEFGRMNKSASTLISDNISSVNICRDLNNIIVKYNTQLLEEITVDVLDTAPNLEHSRLFLTNLDSLKVHLTTERERAALDSVMFSFVTYSHVVRELDTIWKADYPTRNEWYFARLQVVYSKMRVYIQNLTDSSQKALANNYNHLRESFYRGVMPIIIAVAIGIILIFLFNYFIDIYLINPILKMNRGLLDYMKFRKKYNVTVEQGSNQVQELNNSIKDILEENKKLKKK
ncbi:MAG: hypothetical protein WCS34_05135 [Bacteroidales bacterium]